jgi:hypothetical protein
MEVWLLSKTLIKKPDRNNNSAQHEATKENDFVEAAVKSHLMANASANITNIDLLVQEMSAFTNNNGSPNLANITGRNSSNNNTVYTEVIA